MRSCYQLATFLYLLGSFLDAFDGHYARKFGQGECGSWVKKEYLFHIHCHRGLGPDMIPVLLLVRFFLDACDEQCTLKMQHQKFWEYPLSYLLLRRVWTWSKLSPLPIGFIPRSIDGHYAGTLKQCGYWLNNILIPFSYSPLKRVIMTDWKEECHFNVWTWNRLLYKVWE